MPQDCRKMFFSVVSSLIEKSPDAKLLKTITRIVDDWVKNRVSEIWTQWVVNLLTFCPLLTTSMIIPLTLVPVFVRKPYFSLAWWRSMKRDFQMTWNWTHCFSILYTLYTGNTVSRLLCNAFFCSGLETHCSCAVVSCTVPSCTALCVCGVCVCVLWADSVYQYCAVYSQGWTAERYRTDSQAGASFSQWSPMSSHPDQKQIFWGMTHRGHLSLVLFSSQFLSRCLMPVSSQGCLIDCSTSCALRTGNIVVDTTGSSSVLRYEPIMHRKQNVSLTKLFSYSPPPHSVALDGWHDRWASEGLYIVSSVAQHYVHWSS